MTDQTTAKSNGNDARLKRRKSADKRFRAYGLIAIVVALLALVALFTSIIGQGFGAFTAHTLTLEVYLDEDVIDPEGDRDQNALFAANYQGLVKKALYKQFPDVKGRRTKRQLTGLVSTGSGGFIRNAVTQNPDLIGQTVTFTLPLSDDADMAMKGYIDRETPQANRRVKDKQFEWLDSLEDQGKIERQFNLLFFTSGDSREPELAGIWGAVVGSFYSMIVTLALSFPVAVGAAIYLEEFARRNRLTDIIEVNINNLAAVPSIVYGLLGLAIFLNFMELPRSAPLVGGMVLALMTIPTIIIAARAALKSVPPSIREAALGMGASPMQAVFHHVLPLAMPGILTGTILGVARALGETAPLLMIGMVAFIVDIPTSITEPATALPVQIYLWADSPERAFVEKTSAAILVLLAFLISMNGLAIYLRKKFERRW